MPFVVSHGALGGEAAAVGVEVATDGSPVGDGVVHSVEAEADELEHQGRAPGVSVVERPWFHELPNLCDHLIEGTGRVVLREVRAAARLLGDDPVVPADPVLDEDAVHA